MRSLIALVSWLFFSLRELGKEYGSVTKSYMQIAQISDSNVWGFLLGLICLHFNVNISTISRVHSLQIEDFFKIIIIIIIFFPLQDKLFCCYSSNRSLGTVKSGGETKMLQSGA